MGFESLSPERRKEIAQRGGRKAHEVGKAHQFTSEEAKVAGQKGGISISQDREHMSKIGRKGGRSVAEDREHMAKIGAIGGANGKGVKKK